MPDFNGDMKMNRQSPGSQRRLALGRRRQETLTYLYLGIVRKPHLTPGESLTCRLQCHGIDLTHAALFILHLQHQTQQLPSVCWRSPSDDVVRLIDLLVWQPTLILPLDRLPSCRPRSLRSLSDSGRISPTVVSTTGPLDWIFGNAANGIGSRRLILRSSQQLALIARA